MNKWKFATSDCYIRVFRAYNDISGGASALAFLKLGEGGALALPLSPPLPSPLIIALLLVPCIKELYMMLLVVYIECPNSTAEVDERT